MYFGSMIPKNFRSGHRLNTYFCIFAPRDITQPVTYITAVPTIRTFDHNGENPGFGCAAIPQSGRINSQPNTIIPPQNILKPRFSWITSYV